MDSIDAQIFDLVEQMLHYASEHERNEFVPQMMAQLKQVTGKDVPELSLTECHVIDEIGTASANPSNSPTANNHQSINAARIAKNIGMTRGGVSKIVSRLKRKGYLETMRKKDNGKEFELILTNLGNQAFAVHAKLHEANISKWSQLLNSYTPEQKALLLDMIRRIYDSM